MQLLFPLIKLAKKLKEKCATSVSAANAQTFPLIKLAKKLKVENLKKLQLIEVEPFPLIKLAKKLKEFCLDNEFETLTVGFH